MKRYYYLLPKIKDKRYSDDVDIIFILGGDGTVNELVNGIMKSELNLPIGIIQEAHLMIL